MSEARTFFDWTDEAVADVTRRYRDGEAPTTIAASYGITRNCVNSKLDRLGVLRRRGPSEPVIVAGRALKAPPMKPKAAVNANNVAKGFLEVKVKRDRYAGNGITAKNARRAKAVIAGSGAVILVPPSQPPKAEVKADAYAPLPGSTPRPFITRGFNECSWPVGPDGSEQLSCCNRVHKRGWCMEHFLLGTQPLAAKARWDKALKIPGSRRAA